MKREKSLDVFSTMPVSQAVIKNAIPAMVAMLMVLIYNLADTFFIGQTHNAYQVAAVSLATPVFLCLWQLAPFSALVEHQLSHGLWAKEKQNMQKKYVRFVCGAVLLWEL